MLLQSLPQGSASDQQLQDYIRELSEHHGTMDFMSYMAGAVAGKGLSERHKQLLQQLKSGDETFMMQAVIDLASELSMAQDTALSQQALEQFVQPLIDCLRKTGFPDIVLYATICITNIVDIMPSLCNKLASMGGVELLCQKLANVDSFELVENVIHALEKIALENPYSILTGNGILYMSQLIDFFDFQKQKKVLSLLIAIAKSINVPQDIETYVAPATQNFKTLLRYRDGDEKSKEIMELATTFYILICDAVSKFYEFAPTSIPKFRKDYELCITEDIIDSLFEMIIVGSSSPGFSVLSAKTWQNIMATLRYGCKFSPKIYKYVIEHGILNVIQGMLSEVSQTDTKPTENEKSTITQEASESSIILLDALLPQKHLIATSGKDAEYEAERFVLENEREKILLEQGGALEALAEAVLSNVIHIYDESPALSTKFFCLQTIDKLLNLCDPKAISTVFDPLSAALFIYDNLSSVESIFVCFGLRLSEIILQKMLKVNKQYLVSFKREGVFSMVKTLHDFGYLEKQYGQQPDKGWFVAENPYVKHFLSFAAKMDPKSTISPTKKASALEQAFLSKYGNQPPLYGQRSLQSQLKYYAFYKSEQLLTEFLENPVILKTEEMSQAAAALLSCKKLGEQLDELLKQGITGTLEQWKDVYQRFAECLLEEKVGITNYELKCNGIISKIYYSLCMMPTDYVRTMLAAAQEEAKADSEEVKINVYRGPQRAELNHMVYRHDIFADTICKYTVGKKNALSIFIKRLNEILMRIEKFISEPKNEESDPLLMMRGLGSKINLMLMYSPNGAKIAPGFTKLRKLAADVPEDLRKVPELARMHDMYSRMPGFPISLHPWTTLKSVEGFLKNKAPQFSDIFDLKAPSLQHSYSSNVKKEEFGGNLPATEDLDDPDEEIDTLDPHEMPIIPPLLTSNTADKQLFGEESENINIPPAPILGPSSSTIVKPKAENSLPILSKTQSQTSENIEKKVRFGFKFYYNGYEITNKSETLSDIVSKYSNKNTNYPKDAQGVLLFQIIEKKSDKAKSALLGSEDYEGKIEKIIKGQLSFIEGLSAQEQELLSVCLNDSNFTISQIKDQDVIAALKLLKLLYKKHKYTWLQNKFLMQEISHITDSDFLNAKIERLTKKQAQDPLQMLAFNINPWIKSICTQCPFMLTQKTRTMIFKLCFFDKARSLHFMMQEIKGSIPLALPVPSIGKMQRMKLKVNRKAIIDCGIKAMMTHGSTRALLEYDFFDENGSGLGPTLEYYSVSAAALRELDFLWRPTDKGTLFPAPINPDSIESGIKGVPIHKICQIFKLAGWLCARAIIDDRLVDLPFADIFWELVLGKHGTLSDLKKVDQRNGAFFIELDRLKQKKHMILNNLALSEEVKLRQISNLTIGDGYKLEDVGLSFVLQGYDHIELKKGGKDIMLTMDNIEEYLDLTTLYTLYKTVYPQINAFKEGFEISLSIDSLRCFKMEELEDLVCGGKEEKWDPAILSEWILPSNGYDKASPQYSFMIQYLSQLNTASQRLFLQYATGSPRLPFGGFAKLNPKLSIAKRITPEGKKPDDFLPSVMTCQNFLKVPEYATYEILKTKFDYALKEGLNSFTLS